jgi:hypothetical protein
MALHPVLNTWGGGVYGIFPDLRDLLEGSPSNKNYILLRDI